MTRPATTHCPHIPPCPGAFAPDREAARVVVDHCEQEWVVLCNGVVRLEDWELLPDGTWQLDPVSAGAQALAAGPSA